MGIARSEPEMQKRRSKEAWLIPYKTAKAACVTVFRVQDLCGSRGGRPVIPSLINLRFL